MRDCGVVLLTKFEHIDGNEYRDILSRFASGVTIVTARVGDEIRGMTVSAFCSVSLSPPLVLVCLAVGRPTTKLIAKSGWYGVNVLAADQAKLSELFAFGDSAARMDGVLWTTGPNGVPLLDGVIGSLECRVVQTHLAGDHEIVVGQAVHGASTDGQPIVYTQRQYHSVAPIAK